MKVLEVNVDDIGMGGVFSLVRSIIKNKPEGVVVDIAAIEPFENPDNLSELASFGCTVHYVGRSGSKLLKQFYVFRNVRRLVSQGGYDVVHIHSDVSNKLIVSALAAKMAGCRKILLHSHASGVDGDRRAFKKLCHYACRRLLKRVGTGFLTCSDLAARWMFPNIKASDVVMIKNGINLDSFRFSEARRKEVRQQLGVSGELLVGHVGRFAYQKNHEFLIDAFKELHVMEPSAKLLLVGEGPLLGQIRAKVDEKGLSGSVIFYGVSRTVYDLFQAMDVFALPSHFEGLPIVGVEAQAAGLPCVMSDQISRETNVAGASKFLPITPGSETRWAKAILSAKVEDRTSAADVMLREGFSISDTVARLWQAYSK